MLRLADYLLSKLSDLGIKHLFYVPGGQCVFLCDALRRSENIKGISMHHEQAVAMAAVAYSTLNETIGAGLVTTGCAGTNTLTGVLHAYQDSIPLIIISGQQNYENTVKASGIPIRQIGIQEADIETLVKPITKYAVTVSDPSEIRYHFEKAVYLATHGRKGPVWLDIPLNVQNTMIDENNLIGFSAESDTHTVSADELEYLKKSYSESKRPVLLAGNGIRSAYAKAELKALAEELHLPVVFSRLAADILPYNHEYNFGIIGGVAGADRYANFIVQNSDLIISVGSRLSMEVTGGDRASFAREAKVLVVDVDEVEHQKKGVKIDRFINSDAKLFLEAVKELNLPKVSEEWLEKCRHWKDIFNYPMQCDVTHIYPELADKTFQSRDELISEITSDDSRNIDMKLFMTMLSQIAPAGTVYVSDAGLTGAAGPAATEFKSKDRFVMALSQGEMGFALPGGCGASTLTDGPVVSYSGDGSVMMNLQELQTVVRNQFNLKIVIVNNNGYSGVRHGQKAHFRGKSIGTDPSCGLDFPSYEKIAAAFGINYLKISKYSEIKAVLSEVFSDSLPCVLEVMTDPNQYDLHNGLVMYDKRKFGFRPIEDQSPYMDRELFFKEMIVEPLPTSGGKPV
ncbi:thiamine pyrophosphate-binding protein [Succinivibrio dextrinosolvens]|uniref:thiamine pyrophosphate-binding protein n=1 Tax=Succinivibrio dextrinosolvens TaxID=83771 RepID=UPI0004E258DE|nr:thiamine pyrophosphate-binding protein [Succinivibrio dextrinosolvens]